MGPKPGRHTQAHMNKPGTRSAKQQGQGNETARTRFQGHHVYNLATVVSDVADRSKARGLGRDPTHNTDNSWTKEERTWERTDKTRKQFRALIQLFRRSVWVLKMEGRSSSHHSKVVSTAEMLQCFITSPQTVWGLCAYVPCFSFVKNFTLGNKRIFQHTTHHTAQSFK